MLYFLEYRHQHQRHTKNGRKKTKRLLVKSWRMGANAAQISRLGKS